MSNKKDPNQQRADNSRREGLPNSFTRREMVIGSTTLAGLAAVGVAGAARSNAAQPSPSESPKSGSATEADVATEGEIDIRFTPSVATPSTGEPDHRLPTRQKDAVPRRKFAGKVVLITGATSGIGRATAFAFAREGAHVVFCGRRENLGKQIEQQIKTEGGEAVYVRADVMRPDDLKNLVDTAMQRYGGRIDVAFNNAGYEGRVVPFLEDTLDNYDTVMTTNARGMYNCLLLEAPIMVRQGGGVIINMSSVGGFGGNAVAVPYVASKHAIMGMTKSVAIALADKNVRVNALVPAYIDTSQVDRFLHNDKDKKAQAVQNDVPMKRIGKVEETANMVLWMASPECSFSTGAPFFIDGGQLAPI